MEKNQPESHVQRSALESTEGPRVKSPIWVRLSILGVMFSGTVLFFIYGPFELKVRDTAAIPVPVEVIVPAPPSTPEPLPPPAPNPAPPVREITPPESPSEDQPLSLPELAKSILRSVVQIVGVNEDGQEFSGGSGFVVREDGVVATNRHVIDEAASLKILSSNGEELAFEGVLYSPIAADIVLLKVAASGIPALSLEKVKNPVVGESVAVVGSPLGLDGTLSTGIVSAVRRDDGTASGMSGGPSEIGVIQISSPISHGSSGSPVVNERGHVIGVATAMLSGGQNLNFALPVRHIRYLLVVAGDLEPIPVSAAFPKSEKSVTKKAEPKSPAPSEPSPEELKNIAAGVALAYLRFGDSGAPRGQGVSWYSDPIEYFDQGLISLEKAISLERAYESKWPFRMHVPLNEPYVELMETGRYGVEVTSSFAISDNKKQFKQMRVTTGFVVELFSKPKIVAVRTVESETKVLNKFQFRRLVEQMMRE